jgi:hypothetical protein
MSATDKAYKSARRLRRELSLPEKLLWGGCAEPKCDFAASTPSVPMCSIFTVRPRSWRSRSMAWRTISALARGGMMPGSIGSETKESRSFEFSPKTCWLIQMKWPMRC